MTDSTALLVAAEVLLSSLAVVGILFWLLRRRNRDARNLERRLREQSHRLAQRFLERELAATQELARRAAQDELSSTLARLRAFWLGAEIKALVDAGGHLSDQQQLAESLKSSRIYAQLRARPTARPEPPDSQRLDSARELIERQQTGASIAEPVSPDFPDSVRALADAAAGIGGDSLKTLTQLEHDLRLAQQQYSQVTSELEALQQLREADGGSSGVIAVDQPQPGSLQRSQDLLADMEQNYSQATRELQRLRETNIRQRDLILKLEGDLTQLIEMPGVSEEATQIIEKLQLQLRDYDNCTVILEMESEALRERINTLTDLIRDEQEAVGYAFTPATAEQILRMKRELDRLSLSVTVQVGRSANIEEAAATLLEALKARGLRVVMRVVGSHRQLWLSSEGAIDSRVKSLLQSIEPNINQPAVEDGEGLMVLYPRCRLHLSGAALQGGEGQQMRLYVDGTLRIIDVMFMLLDARETATAAGDGAHLQEVTKLIATVEGQQGYLGAETQRIADDHRQQVTRLLENLKVSDSQKIVIEGLLDDFSAEINIVTRASKAMHKNLLVVQQSLAELTENRGKG